MSRFAGTLEKADMRFDMWEWCFQKADSEGDEVSRVRRSVRRKLNSTGACDIRRRRRRSRAVVADRRRPVQWLAGIWAGLFLDLLGIYAWPYVLGRDTEDRIVEQELHKRGIRLKARSRRRN
jgi:hypothetical protein